MTDKYKSTPQQKIHNQAPNLGIRSAFKNISFMGKDVIHFAQQNQKKLGKALWKIAKSLLKTRAAAMSATDLRDYMLTFLFLRHLSDHYEATAQRELGNDYPKSSAGDHRTPLAIWYEQNKADTPLFEKHMRRRLQYVIAPEYLWRNLAEMAIRQDAALLKQLNQCFRQIENDSLGLAFLGLFSNISLDSDKLGESYDDRNARLCTLMTKIDQGLASFSTSSSTFGDVYEYLIGQFATVTGRRGNEFYTTSSISSILSEIVVQDKDGPNIDRKKRLDKVLDFACGSGSLLLNVRKKIGVHGIGKLYGQEKNSTICQLARMNMLLHGVKLAEFDIFHGDTLLNEWDKFHETNPAKKLQFDGIVSHPPFSLRWDHETMAADCRFKHDGLAPKYSADFAFLLHGFHFLAPKGTMAIILTHGALFRGGEEEHIRTKLLKDGCIDAVISLPANLFFSTGVPTCILALKKCKKSDDVLFINATEHFKKIKRKNYLLPKHVDKIVRTYQYRTEEAHYSVRASMKRIEQESFNLDVSRYISTTSEEKMN